MTGVALAVKNDYDNAVHSFRYVGEAMMKALIYKHYGECDGHLIIKGRMNTGRQPTGTVRNLSYSELLAIVKSLRLAGSDVQDMLEKVNSIANNCGSHDPNGTAPSETEKEENLELDICYCEKITDTMYAATGKSKPAELTRAYRERTVDESLMNRLKAEDCQEILQSLDNFNPQTRYVLISPESFDGVTRHQLRMLRNIHWSFVIDFNPSTKKAGGLYEAFMPEIAGNCTPLTVNDDNIGNIVGNGTRGNTNWVFANGLDDMPSTLVQNTQQWIKKRYHKFIKQVFRTYFMQRANRINIVCLYDNYRHIEEIVREFDDIDEIEKDLVDITVLSPNSAFLDSAIGLGDYGFNINRHNVELTSFLALVADNGLERDTPKCIQMPGRSGTNDKVVDITDIYSKLLSNGIEPVHLNIVPQKIESKPVPDFFKGETITWEEMAEDTDVRRDIYDELLAQVRSKLGTSRSSKRFNILHRPGAGGTTIARRIAFDLHRTYPVVILTKNKQGATFRDIDLLSRTVGRTVLAVVESSVAGNIDELIKECNSHKRIVVFLVVDRETRRTRKLNDKSLYARVNDMMATPEEKTRFLAKAKQYSPTHVSNLERIPYGQSEVIEYAMSIGEKSFNVKQLETYVKSYADQLSEQVSRFLGFVSIVYRYSQRPVNELLFRKMFENGVGRYGIGTYLAKHPDENEALRKLIVQTHDADGPTGLWRPRFSRFADVIMAHMLGGSAGKWHDYLPQFSMDMIKELKSNNEYINEEVKTMLTSVFLCRGKEDPLGMEENWESAVANDRFSALLEDIAYMPSEQKRILKKLTECYPDESHFWGHLARYCYEKADTLPAFEEADRYAEKALAVNGKNDFVILHVAGMCKRRIIEYHKRHNKHLGFETLRELTEASQYYFISSREVKPQNIHAYVSEIQMLVIVIEFGKKMSGYNSYLHFLTDPDNEWYLEKFERIQNLIVEARMLIDQLRTLGIDQRIVRTTNYIIQGEQKCSEFIGDYATSLLALRKRIEEVERSERPKLRLLYITTLLKSKMTDDTKCMDEAWRKLTPNEVSVVEKFLDSNILSGGDNAFSLRMWFQFLRYTDNNISEDEAKSRLLLLYRNSDNEPMLRLEAAYYLYVISAVQLICDNDSFDQNRIKEIKEYQKFCRKYSPNAKFSYEWLSSLDGMRGIVNYRYTSDTSRLVRLTGSISSIRSQAQGDIELDCGLHAFFVPGTSNFVEGHDETTRVSFSIGFRHDSIYAFDVQRVDVAEAPVASQLPSDENLIEPIEELDADEKAVEELTTIQLPPATTSVFRLDSEKQKPVLKTVGKIKLSERDLKKDRWKKK